MSMGNNPQPSPFERPRTSGLAIASLVLSCMSFVIGPAGFVPGIICGHLAMREIHNHPELDGNGLAVAGLIIGYISLGICLFMFLFLLLILSDVSTVHTLHHLHELNSAASLFLAGWPR